MYTGAVFIHWKYNQLINALSKDLQGREARAVIGLLCDVMRYKVNPDFSYTIKQVYAVVASIDQYPEFVPWCVRTEQVDASPPHDAINNDTRIEYWEMSVGFKMINDSYTSKVTLSDEKSIKVCCLYKQD